MTPEEEAEIARVEAILADPNHPEWFETWCYVTEIGYGPPAEREPDSPIEVSNAGKEPVTLKVVFVKSR